MCMIPEIQFSELAEGLQPIVDFMNECLRSENRLDEVERGLHQCLQDLGRNLVGKFVDLAGDGDCGPKVERDGRSLKRSSIRHTKRYQSIFGVLQIQRYVYSVRDKQAFEYVPTDAKLGIPENDQSFVLEDWSQRLTTVMPYEKAQEMLQELLGVLVSVRALETINQRMADFVQPYWESAPSPAAETEGEVIVVSADGKGVPMRQSQEDRLEQELGKKKVVREPKTNYQKTEKRRGRGGRKSRKQMAYLGVVYSVDRFPREVQDVLDEVHRKAKYESRPEPQNKRFQAELNDIVEGELSEGQPRLFDWAASEVTARNPSGNKTVVCLMDGQKSLRYWAKARLPDAIGILDLFHVLERLWKAAHCFHKESSVEAEQFVEKYLRMMLDGNIGCVIGVFRRFAKNLRGTKKKELTLIINFFDHNKEYMRYGEYIKAGYPIGSGVIEGGCRHVVRDRMELSGMRWNVPGAQAMLRLRTTRIAGDWKPFIKHRIQSEITRLYGLAH